MRLALVAFFCLLWGGSAAWAQAVPVDSPEECRTLGGTWTQRDWQAACQTPWDRAECLRLGGAWAPAVRGPGAGTCTASVSREAIVRQCEAAGGSWGPAGSPMPLCQRAAPRARQAADAGKLCDSQRDCSYGCIYQGTETRVGADVMGRCRADNRRTGCFWIVEAGRLSGRMCLD
jgi:hypothetical protein